MAGPISCGRIDPTRSGAKILQAGTFNANPLMLTAGLTTLRLLTPDVYTRMASMARRVRDELVAAFREAGFPPQETLLAQSSAST